MGRRWTQWVVLCVVGLVACGSDGASSEPDAGNSGSGGGAGGTIGGSGAGVGGSGATGGTWGFGASSCPDAEPEVGSACSSVRGTCEFAGRECDCADELGTWVCWDPALCPSEQPAEQAGCDSVGMSCSFGPGASCSCTAAGWDCGGQFCPQVAPTVGEACQRARGDCSYDALVCDCVSSETWACWNPADCPMSPPDEGASCSNDGMRCSFGRGRCECSASEGWGCDRRVVRDDDAGVDDGDAGM